MHNWNSDLYSITRSVYSNIVVMWFYDITKHFVTTIFGLTQKQIWLETNTSSTGISIHIWYLTLHLIVSGICTLYEIKEQYICFYIRLDGYFLQLSQNNCLHLTLKYNSSLAFCIGLFLLLRIPLCQELRQKCLIHTPWCVRTLIISHIVRHHKSFVGSVFSRDFFD